VCNNRVTQAYRDRLIISHLVALYLVYLTNIRWMPGPNTTPKRPKLQLKLYMAELGSHLMVRKKARTNYV